MACPRLTRILIAPVAAVTLAGGLSLVPASAHADIATKIVSAKAQLAALQDQAEQAAEDYDAGQIKLAAANRVAAQKQAAAATAAAALEAAKQSVAAIATLAYSQGATGDTTLLYQGSDPAGFVDRAALVNALSRSDESILSSVHAAQQQAITTRKAAGQALGVARSLVADLASARARVEAAAAQQGTLLNALIAQQREQLRQAAIALAKAIASKKAADIRRARAAQLAAQQAEADLEQRRANQLRAAQDFAQQKDNENRPDSGSSGGTGGTTGGSVGGGDQGGGSGSGDNSGGGSGSGNTGSVGGSSSGGSTASTAVHWAHNELGKAYVWAASGPNHFDCSGLTMYVYRQAGVYLPHSSRAQFNSGRRIHNRGDLRAGDLVFFGSPIHHVGLYIGNGQMIDAPESGENVRVADAFRGDYVGAVRVTG